MASNHGAIPKRKLSRYGLKRIGVNTVYRPKSFDSLDARGESRDSGGITRLRERAGADINVSSPL